MVHSYEKLYAYMDSIPIIDAHEHLMPERESLADGGLDLIGALMAQYVPTVFNAAGMGKGRQWLTDKAVPLNERWAAFSPLIPAVRQTGYFRTVLYALKELYGIERLDDTTYKAANECIRGDLKPGWYDTVLKNKCRIERILNQSPWGHDEGYNDFAPDIVREPIELNYIIDGGYKHTDAFGRLLDKYGGGGMGVDEFCRNWVQSYHGVKHGIKISANIPFPRPTTAEANAQLSTYRTNRNAPCDRLILYTLHKIIELCGEYGLVAAVHCGIIWDNWQDFYIMEPRNVYQALMTYRGTTFDLYHAAIPWVREMGVIGNQYPNANLNLTWAHEISPAMTRHFLDEWMDLVPLNKMIGFGADSRTPFLTVGNRKITFENIAAVLAKRIDGGLMDYAEAEMVCKMWLYDNPKRVYKL
jgi:hypothetical protein